MRKVYMQQEDKVDISVIVPVIERYDNLCKLYFEFSSAFAKLEKSYEFIFVIPEEFCKAIDDLKALQNGNLCIKIIKQTRNLGESIALSIGVERAQGDYIFTLASYFQVEPESVNTIWLELMQGVDLAITRRYPRFDSKFNRVQSFLFHWLINKIASTNFHDISCGLKGMKRDVFNEINIYGDLHRFIPILADKHGFKIKEIKAKQRKENREIRVLTFGSYVRRLLDIFTIFFITKFSMKPLRFFGLLGMSIGGIGGSIVGYFGVYKLLGFGGISDKPLLLLGVILIVLGVQTISIGLIGEIFIFTHAKNLKEYKVEKFLS